MVINLFYKKFLFKIKREDDAVLFQDENGKRFKLTSLKLDVFDWGVSSVSLER